MKIPFNKKWIFIEREDYANYLFVVDCWLGYTYLPKIWQFPVGKYLVAEYINSACNFYILKSGHDKNNQINFQNLFVEPYLWDRLHKMTKKNSDKLFKLAKIIKKLNVEELSNKELLKWINIFHKVQGSVHTPRGPMWLLETPDNIVTNYLHNYLSEKYNDSKNNIKTKPYGTFQILTAPLQKSNWTKEKEGLAKIGLLKNKKQRDIYLLRHARQYEWLEYGLQGKILDLNYFKNELNKMKKQNCNIVLRGFQNEVKELRKKQAKLIKEYKIHPRHQRIFKIVQDASFTKLYSKDSQFYGYYCIEDLLKEIGRRTGLSLEQARFLAPEDSKEILIKNKDFSQITLERQKYSIHITHGGKIMYYLGQEARKIRNKMKIYQTRFESKKSEIIKGQPAFSGKAKGRVKIINTIQEMVKMHAGNILVSHMTNPGIVPVMKMAKAIVTDLGGITSHAAIIARELKKPCVIGTKIATKVLKDGDMVEVNANKGIVKKL